MNIFRAPVTGWAGRGVPSALAVGVFDGLHRGHRAVLAATRERAAVSGLAAGVVTFDPHPMAVVAPERAPSMITTVEQRLELFAAAGMDLAVVLPFDAATRAWTPEQFASDLLAGTLGARVVLAGADFRFGRDRSGDMAALAAIGSAAGFETLAVPLVGGDRPVSSSQLRDLIATGEVAAVAEELGRPHELRGIAQSRGDGLLVPIPPGMAVPAAGSYAATVGRDRAEVEAAHVTVGRDLSLEVPGDPGLAGWHLRVRFLHRD